MTISIYFTSNHRVIGDWPEDLTMRHGTPYTHLQRMTACFPVYLRVCAWPHSILCVDVTTQMKVCLVGEEILIKIVVLNEAPISEIFN